MTEYIVSNEGVEISVVELEKTFVLTVDGRELTLSKDKAGDLAEVLHAGECCGVLESEFFYH